jgi:hypothetical protein
MAECEVCTCKHPPEDHVIRMSDGEPTLACIAFHCDCRLNSPRLVKAS